MLLFLHADASFKPSGDQATQSTQFLCAFYPKKKKHKYLVIIKKAKLEILLL